MKSTKRAERRRNNRRILKERYKEEKGTSYYGCTAEEREQHDSWALVRARKRLNTNTLCSCMMCRSPRKYVGNGVQGLTLDEQVQKEIMKESVDTWYEEE